MARSLTSLGLSLMLVVPALLDAGCASHSQDRLNAAIATLSSNGVGVYDSYGAAAPLQTLGGVRSAMKVTRWQLNTMVSQADAGMGMRGADIDRLVAASAPKTMPPFSYFIAAWLKNGASPLALYGRELMGKQTDYKHAPKMTFSLLVITLLIADIARLPNDKRTASVPGLWWESLVAQPARADGICSTFSDFLKSTVLDIENA